MKGKAIVEQIRKDNIVRTDGLVTASIRAHVLRRLSEEKKRLVAEHFALLEDDDDFDDEDDFDDSDFDNGEDEEDFDDDEDDEDLVDEGLKPTDPSRKTRKAHDKKVQRAAGKKIKESLTADQTKLVKAVLSNDENSTDEELIDYFMNAGISKSDAQQWVAKRDKYLNGMN